MNVLHIVSLFRFLIVLADCFCLHFEALQLCMAPVCMAFLQFMGDNIEARNFSYTLEVGGNCRKLTSALEALETITRKSGTAMMV